MRDRRLQHETANRKEVPVLHRTKELVGDRIVATDGEVGQVDDVYFDDQRWGMRYLVVNTGDWLQGRKVLISPASIDRSRSAEAAISVNLSRKQVAQSPDVDTEKPVSRQYEEAYASYYGYPYYWAAAPVPIPPVLPSDEERRERSEAERKASESHLRSSEEVIGYAIEASDGTVGHVEDLLVDDGSWSVAELVVDTRNWLPGRNVLVSPSAVEGIDWKARQVRLRMRREEIERQPGAY